MQASNCSLAAYKTEWNLANSFNNTVISGSVNISGMHSVASTTPQFFSKLHNRQCVYCNLIPVSPFTLKSLF